MFRRILTTQRVALISISVLACVLATALLTLDGASPGSTVSVTEIIPQIPDWTPGEAHREGGMSYKRPATLPAVLPDRAIAAANTRKLSFPEAPRISARHELMSFEDPNVWAGALAEAGLGRHKLFRDIPVWIVSYEGVEVATSAVGAVGTAQGLRYNREMNVVVSAENGEVLGAFTYR